MNFKTSFGKAVAGSVAALWLASSAHAAWDSKNTNIPEPCSPPEPVCCEMPPPGPYAFAAVPDQPVSCPQGFNLSAAFLIMQAKEDGLEFALWNENGTNLPLTNGRILGFSDHDRDWHYNPGARVNIGFDMAQDDWNIGLAWTWLNIANYRKANAGAGQSQYSPLWFVPQNGPGDEYGPANQTSLSATWRAHYDTLDACIAKSHLVSRYLDFNTHFGVRAAWIYQKLNVNYGGIWGVGPDITIGTGGTVYRSFNDFAGFGPRMGFQSSWELGKGWNLFGNLAGSFLFGVFDVNQSVQDDPFCTEDGGFDLDSSFYQNVPNFEMQIGINWRRLFDRGNTLISFSAAYEFHEWWDQNNWRRFQGYELTRTTFELQNDRTSRGDLTLNGFSFTLGLTI